MLNRTFFRLGSVCLGLFLTVAIVGFGSAASADSSGGFDCDDFGNCSAIVDEGGAGGGGSSSGGDQDPVAGTKPGAKSCSIDGEEIPCKEGDAHWQPGAQCYMKLAEEQDSPPSGQAKTDGAWYTCQHVSVSEEGVGCVAAQSFLGDLPDDRQLCGSSILSSEWSESPPPGVAQLTPAQAAQRLVESFQLKGPDFTTSISKPESGAVGLPVWLWVPKENQKALNWGPYKKSATLGGVTISAEARVSSVAYDMGDGTKETCLGAGHRYWPQTNLEESPNCGHRYEKMSPGEGKSPYQIEGRATWQVKWSGGGDSGQITTYTDSTRDGYVGEIQVVNVS